MEKITNPELIKRNLLVASLFVTSFEMLKTSVQDRIKGILCINSSFNNEGELEFEISEDYKSQVLERHIGTIDRHKQPDFHLFYSSCLWLKDKNAINKKEMKELQQIRKHRNLISHNPLKLLVDDNTNVNITLLKKSQELLTKIEKWWIVKFEIPANPDYDGLEIDETQIHSGTTIFLDFLMEIAGEEIHKNEA